MKKKTNYNLPIVFMIVLAMIAIVIFLSSRQSSKNEQLSASSTKSISEYNQLMSVDFLTQYPDSPQQLLELNNRYVKYLYGGSVSESEIHDIIEKQREMFAPALLELNELETSVSVATLQILQMQSDAKRIIDIKNSLPTYDKSDENICIVTVTQYMTNNQQDIIDYTLVKIDNRWKIFRFDRPAPADEADGNE